MSGYLQLAENPYSHLADSNKELYVFVPAGYRGATKDLYIREDAFDNLPAGQWDQLMDELEPYQNTGMAGIFSRNKEKRQARKDARSQKKSTKSALKVAKKDARLKRVQSGETGLKTLIGGAKDIVGSIFGTPQDKSLDVNAGGGGLDISYNENPSFFEQYKTPIFIVGGLGLAFLGYKAISSMNKKKK
jgi:hypothetical protein